MRIWTLILVAKLVTSVDFVYHNYDEATSLLHDLVAKYPSLCQLYSIGKSVESRELWVLRVTDGVDKDVPIMRPRVKWVANMHGDETVGRELTFQMAQYLTENYQTNATVASFLTKIDLHLMPSLNPDGFEKSKEGKCETGWRSNANRVDLNRNFPDQFRDPKWKSDRQASQKLEVETQAMVDWIESSHFVLSLNLHAGSVVASYPYDDSKTMRGAIYSASPDDDYFKHLARTFADNHGSMATMDGKSCGYTEKSFHRGITNGAEWYQVPGGMEDYNYLYGDCFEITIELTCCKYPKASALKSEWDLNQNALWSYTLQAYQSARGRVTDSQGRPLDKVVISVDGIDKDVHTDPEGVYWRPLVNGAYTITATAPGYLPETEHVIIGEGGVEHDFTLVEVNETADDENADSDDFEFKYHTYDELTALLKQFEATYPTLCKLHSAGQTVQQREMWVMEVSDNPGVHEPLEPEFKYVGNMHGNEIKGRIIAIKMIHHLLTNYATDAKIAEIVNSRRLFFMPSMNPDGHEKALAMIASKGPYFDKTKTDTYGRENADNVDLNRDFPDHFYPERPGEHPIAIETKNMISWSEQHHFVLSLNVHGGALVANYPFDDSAEYGENSRRRERRVAKYPPSRSLDEDVFVHLAKVYASHHPTMFKGLSCRSDAIGIAEVPRSATMFGPETFPEGIVNGQQWYPVAGGMQDWNYWQTGCFELTVELGCVKFPAVEYLAQYWEANKDSTLAIIEAVDIGASGMVRDEHQTPIENAKIVVERREDKAVFTSDKGDYFRPLMPGKYRFEVSAPGHMDIVHDVVVPEDTGRVNVDFYLDTFESDLATTEGPNGEDDLPTTEATVTEKAVVTEKVVTEAAPVVSTEKATTTEKVTSKKTTEVPVTEPVTELETEPVTELVTTTLEVTTKTELRAAENDVDTILSAVDDDSLIKADNLDIVADEVGDTIGREEEDFEYGEENESLPEPLPPQQLMELEPRKVQNDDDEGDFDPNAFLSDEKGDSYMSKYILLLFFIVIAGLVGRVYYVRRQNERIVGFGSIKQVPQSLSEKPESVPLIP